MLLISYIIDVLYNSIAIYLRYTGNVIKFRTIIA